MPQKKHQEPLSINEQIENLKSIGLIIEDDNEAASFLNDVSYFRFIKAYSLGLKPKNGNYNSGVSFDQIKELYLFNSNFRQLLFVQLERIEINLRCRIANYFSSTYGVLGYIDPSNFKNPVYHNSFMQEVQNEVRRNSRAPFIRNFQKNYVNGEIPFYALVEIMSFGSLSKFYKNMLNADKKIIANSFGVPYPYFESWIESFAYVRNICAHYGRLYNAKLSKTPQLFPGDRKNGIGNNRIFGVLICINYILKGDKNWGSFVSAIQYLLIKYPHTQKQTMGFPENWISLLL